MIMPSTIARVNRRSCNSTVSVQEERIRRGDDLRLQMALEESKKEGPGSAKLPKKKKEVKHR